MSNHANGGRFHGPISILAKCGRGRTGLDCISEGAKQQNQRANAADGDN